MLRIWDRWFRYARPLGRGLLPLLPSRPEYLSRNEIKVPPGWGISTFAAPGRPRARFRKRAAASDKRGRKADAAAGLVHVHPVVSVRSATTVAQRRDAGKASDRERS